MGKDKLRRFAEISEMAHVHQPDTEEMLKGSQRMKGNWAKEFFKNDNPIVLELGCGKGEYTLGQAERDPNRNYLGVDIKGARIWKGAKTSREKGMANVGFLRTRIDFIHNFFTADEVSEIWITFPDPQKKDRRSKKRLTHPLFLDRYRRILSPGATINLKTDSSTLYDYTMDVVHELKLTVNAQTIDVYKLGAAKFDDALNEKLAIKTFYEKMWLGHGKKIKYIQFSLDGWSD
jgi:tRNA (guanine-N7-)-methyltransferase